MNKYIPSIFLFLTLSSCFNATRIISTIPENEYKGWFIGTSNGNFFVIEKGESIKRNIAFKLPEYPLNCRLLEGISPLFFRHKKDNITKPSFILGRRDTISFDQSIIICRAKAFYASANSSFIDAEEIKKYKMKASDGVFTINAVWVDIYAQFKGIVLFSNYNNDSTGYPRCR